MRNDPGRLPPLDLLLAFESAARQLSFTKAAAERFLTQSAISRQIKALEDDLGVMLFRRRHRALDLTDDGRRLYDGVSAALGGLRETVSQIRSPRRREVLALTTTPGFASLWLIPRLSAFMQAHPGIDVRIDASLEKRDLISEGFDLAIRYSRIGAATGTPLFQEQAVPVCAPPLARERARPLRVPADLRRHTLLQVAIPPGVGMPLEWEPWLESMGLAGLEPAGILTFNNYDGAVAAALAGQGVALGRRPLIDDLLRARKLVMPFKGEAIASERGYFIVVEQRAQNRPAVRALEAWLLEQANGQNEGSRRPLIAVRVEENENGGTRPPRLRPRRDQA